MTDREAALAILQYRAWDHMPLVHFGFWSETLEKWAAEGHITHAAARNSRAGNPVEAAIARSLGFDFGWGGVFGPNLGLEPRLRRRVVSRLPDGGRHVLNEDGAIVLERPGCTSIPAEVDHLLKGRPQWERMFRPRLQPDEKRLARACVQTEYGALRFDRGGYEYLRERPAPDAPRGLWCGSFVGIVRNWFGVVGLSYMLADDPGLVQEIVDTVAETVIAGVQAALETGIVFDYAYIWEDICFKNGPLVNPRWFRARVGPHYRRLAGLLDAYGVSVVSLDCDGKIDILLPTWLDHGVNTMFPIEVGTWSASIESWRRQYGRAVRGVGGMDKRVFARDRAAVAEEVARLRPLVELGGYLPCPDHLIPPDAEWENVQYYCQLMRESCLP